MTEFDLLIKTSRLRYALPEMQRKVRLAKGIIRRAMSQCERPYIAYSSGKDSQVVLDLVLGERPDVAIVYFDDLWMPDGTNGHLNATEARHKIRILRAYQRHAGKEFKELYGAYPQGTLPHNLDHIVDRVSNLVADYGFDAVVLGLRREESTRRHFAVKRAIKHVKSDGLLHVNPIHDWTWQDVWAYIAGRALPYHPAYRQLIDAGVAPQYARVGPLTAVRVYQYGAANIAKKLWPETWAAFVAANPCVLE